MEALFVLRAVAKALVLPPGGPLLLSLAGLLIVRRSPRLGRTLVGVGTLAMLLLCLPIVADGLMRPFDRSAFDAAQARHAQAIVILGGGSRRDAAEYGNDTLSRRTLERVRYGARIAKQTGLPVLVTGSVPLFATRSEGALMRDALADEYGVAVRWTDERARNTHENARYAAELLKRDGIDRVVIVGHAVDMPRAQAEFTAAGLSSVAAATRLPSRGPIVLSDFLPSALALQDSHDALYEMLAAVERAVRTDR